MDQIIQPPQSNHLNGTSAEPRIAELDQRPLLAVNGLHVEFISRGRLVRAVRGLSYEIHPGETLALVGESGSGKSASALSLLGLLPKGIGRVTGGSAHFEGRDLIRMPERQLRQLRGSQMAMVFQDPMSSLNPIFTIGRQIEEALQAHRGMNRRVARARTVELLGMVGIPNAATRVDDYPHQFSGGMRQRAMIAMALSCEPKLLIADEPTTALDVTIQAQIISLLQRVRSEFRMAVLLITHDLGLVAGFADRLGVMYAGRLVEVGTAESVLAAPAHPYTIGLIQSLPRLDRPQQSTLSPIEGSPPDLSGRMVGCPFSPRCAWKTEECTRLDPSLELARDRNPNTEGVHTVACHNQPNRNESMEGRPSPTPPPSRTLGNDISRGTESRGASG